MICRFSVRNYKSIREKIVLDMSRAGDKEKAITDVDLLPITVLTGANGTGKSNILDAINTLINKVVYPIYAVRGGWEGVVLQENTPVTYAFDKYYRNNCTEFELAFRTKNAEYEYCLDIKRENIEYERLARRDIGELTYITILERGGHLPEECVLKGPLRKLDAIEVSNSLPILSYLGIVSRGNVVIKDIFKWFMEKVSFVNEAQGLNKLEYEEQNNPDFKGDFLKLLNKMKLGIVDYDIVWEGDKMKVFTSHQLSGIKYNLNLCDESLGIQKIFSIMPFIIDGATKGKCILIDGLDEQIHSGILNFIVSIYNDCHESAQLIISLGDLSKIEAGFLKNIEVWNVIRGTEENTEMYRLKELKSLQ